MTGDPKLLNKEQEKAVKFGNGPLLIIAGAGTGKTTVITERVKFLITKKGINPSEILALTFTEKAAREMEMRVDETLPYGYTQMWISTFHSFCERILRAEALQVGLDPKYKLLSESESIQLIRSNLFNFDLEYFRPLGNPNKFIGGMLQHFSRLQDEDITPDDYALWVKKRMKKKIQSEDEKLELKKFLELSHAFKKYEELKVKNGFMDYGDLITKTLKIFRSRKNILVRYQKLFKYILVDEFQDTNVAQNELVKLLVGDTGNITVVADDDQSIYAFRGAAVSNVLGFRGDFPKAKVVVLSKNYRSTQEILDRSYALIQSNNPDRLEVVEKINKKLISTGGQKGEKVNFIHTSRVEQEADEVVNNILSLVKNEDYDWKDFAILVRANNHAEPFSRALARKGVPYQFLGPGRLFKQPEIIDLISYLKVLYNFDDSAAFYRLITIDHFGIDGRSLAMIGNFARRKNISLFEACEKIKEIGVSPLTKEKVTVLLAIINKHLELVKKESAGQILYYFLEDTGMLEKLVASDSAETQKKVTNISKFFDKLKSYEVSHEDASVNAVVDWIELASELGESPLAADSDWSEANAVNILTVHSAKGLEFPVVFLVNLVAQRFPSLERRDQIPIPDDLIKETLPKGDYHLEEERRLFYVGMTRAKERLILTAADYYGEGKREKKLSPFIFEAVGEEGFEKGLAPKVSLTQLSLLDYKPQKDEGRQIEKTPLKIDYLSYSQIETFKTCPLHYKLRYIFKVPTPPSPSQSFGISMHATLKDFYTLVENGETPDEKLIFGLLTKNWIKDGYSSVVHEKKFLEKGKVYLSGFLKEAFNKKSLPVLMEEPFLVPLGELKIGGKIDRVDVLPDGSIEIIDYKTGANIPTQKEVDKNLQLSFYALAATKIPNKPFGIVPDKVKLSLYFLDTQEKFSTVRTAEDLKDAEAEIKKVKEEIESSDFTCSENFLCKNCEYKIICNTEE